MLTLRASANLERKQHRRNTISPFTSTQKVCRRAPATTIDFMPSGKHLPQGVQKLCQQTTLTIFALPRFPAQSSMRVSLMPMLVSLRETIWIFYYTLVITFMKPQIHHRLAKRREQTLAARLIHYMNVKRSRTIGLV